MPASTKARKTAVSKTAKASPQGLEKIKQVVAQKGWRKTSPAFLDAACVSAATLKRFWRGVPIGQDSFRAICRAVNVDCDEVIVGAEAVAIPAAEASNYDDIWVGREALVQQLRKQLSGETRLLSLTGLTGIGKTSLARYLASDLVSQSASDTVSQSECDRFTLIHLSCAPSAPPTLASIAHILSKADTETGTANVPLNPQGIVESLQNNRYLLIIDAIECLLESSEDSGWSHFQNGIWPKFFQAILAANTCKSRIILTSQDIPSELDLLGERWFHRWCAQSLSGLSAGEQMGLFQRLGLAPAPGTQNYDYLGRLGQAYAGHPLSLRVVANDIIQSFQGNVTAYWNEYGHLLASGESPQNLHSHNRQLRSRVQPRLTETLSRLKIQLPHAYQLLQAGIMSYTEPRLSQSWLQKAEEINTPKEQQRMLLDVLSDRALIIPTVINNRLHFSAHPLVRSLLANA